MCNAEQLILQGSIMGKEIVFKKTIEQVIDLLMPELTPYEFSLYILLLRNSFIKKWCL